MRWLCKSLPQSMQFCAQGGWGGGSRPRPLPPTNFPFTGFSYSLYLKIFQIFKAQTSFSYYRLSNERDRRHGHMRTIWFEQHVSPAFRFTASTLNDTPRPRPWPRSLSPCTLSFSILFLFFPSLPPTPGFYFSSNFHCSGTLAASPFFRYLRISPFPPVFPPAIFQLLNRLWMPGI